MSSSQTDFLNSHIQPSSDVKEQLESLLKSTERQISLLKCFIFLNEPTDVLSKFSFEAENFSKTKNEIQKRFDELVPKVSESLQLGGDIAEAIFSDIIKISSIQSTLRESERFELISRYRSEVVSARVLGLLEIALSAFEKLSLHIGAHISSTDLLLFPLPPFYVPLLENFVTMFQDTCKKMEVPKIRPPTNWMENGAERIGDQCPWDMNTMRDFRLLFRTLTYIMLPEPKVISDTAKRVNLSLPVRLLLEPLEKRFLFNFYGNRSTNNPEKPEWYFTEVLTWISINDQWLTWMQDEQLKDVIKPFSNLRGLLSFVMDKISFDLGLLKTPPKPRCEVNLKFDGEGKSEDTDISGSGMLTSPPSFFGHLTDEMLVFEARLDGLYYPSQAIRPADLFTRRLDVLQHWISLESELAHRKLHNILSKPYAWRIENGVPQCFGDFVALVYSISRRAANLRHNATKSMVFFCKIQLDLFFIFLETMVNALPWNAPSSKNPNTKDDSSIDDSTDRLSRWTSILNVLQSVLNTMQEWCNDQYFVEIWEDPESRRLLTTSWDPWMDEQGEGDVVNGGWKTITQRIEAALSEATSPDWSKPTTFTHQRSQYLGVFADIYELYKHRIDGALKRVGQSIFENLQDLAKGYLHDDRQQWTRVEGSNESPMVPSSISYHAGSLFIHLSRELSVTSKALLPSLFTSLWQPVLRNFNQLLYRKLILANQFTSAGASQLKFDIDYSLRGLLMAYSDLLAVDDILAECLDACRLLTLPSGSIHLLKRSLANTDPTTVISSLLELGIRRLTPDEVISVLSHYISTTPADGVDFDF
nr:RAD50 interacting protein 1 [Hymenolepis microstoma]